MEKKQKAWRRKRKIQNISFFKVEKCIFIIEKLTHDITECCKLPEAIELREKIGYNHDNILVWEETSIAEKI